MGHKALMTIGRGGQTPVGSADVSKGQTSFRLRDFGEAKMTDLHLRHT